MQESSSGAPIKNGHLLQLTDGGIEFSGGFSVEVAPLAAGDGNPLPAQPVDLLSQAAAAAVQGLLQRLGGERFPLAQAMGVKIGPHQIFVHSLSFPGLPGEKEAGPFSIRERPLFYDSLRVISAFFSPLWAKKKQEIFLRFPAFCYRLYAVMIILKLVGAILLSVFFTPNAQLV